METGRIEPDLADRARRLLITAAGRGAGLKRHRRLHVLDPVERGGDRAGGVVARRARLGRHQRGQLGGIGVSGKDAGEKDLAALEQCGAAVGGGAHRGEIGLHVGELPPHDGDVAGHRRDRADGGEGGPGEQQERDQRRRHLHAGADPEAAQAAAVMQENIARLEDGT